MPVQILLNKGDDLLQNSVLLRRAASYKKTSERRRPRQPSSVTLGALHAYRSATAQVWEDTKALLRLKIHILSWRWSRQIAITPEQREERKRQAGETSPYLGQKGKASAECVGLPVFSLAGGGRKGGFGWMYTEVFAWVSQKVACGRLCLRPAGLRPQKLNKNLTNFSLSPLIPFPGILVPACLLLGFGGLRFVFFFARGYHQQDGCFWHLHVYAESSLWYYKGSSLVLL